MNNANLRYDMSKKTNLKDWTRKRILAALEDAGYHTIKALADQCGVSLWTINTALCRPSPANEARIAKAIGVSPQVIWPSRYAPDGGSNRLPAGHASRRLPVDIKDTPMATIGNVNITQ